MSRILGLRSFASPARKASSSQTWLAPCRRRFTVLGLESSADDTCAAVVTSDRRILSNVIVKQHDLHEPFGGIRPLLAIHAHNDHMAGAIRRALGDAELSLNDIDGIAYTRGPGMLSCLLVCSNAARSLAAAAHKPVVGVHHMQAHALTALLTTPPDTPEHPEYPFITLLISGGHSLLILATSPTSFKILAGDKTDMSIGRAFDKTTRLLGIPWGARGPGASLEAYVREHAAEDLPAIEPPLTVSLPRQLFLGFAGLFSQVDRFVLARGGVLEEQERRALARAFQDVAIRQLEEKLLLALRWCDGEGTRVRHVVVSGGVASNALLRERLAVAVRQARPDEEIHLVYPPPALCTDNAVMIAWAGMPRLMTGDVGPDELSLAIKPVWSIEDISDLRNSGP